MSYSIASLRLFKRASGIFLLLFLFTGLLLADELTVQPSSVVLAAKQPTATVKLVNTGTESRIVRIRVMSYSDENGREKLSPSTRLLVHPEQVTLKPGASQTVRVGLRLSGPLWDEEFYRLLLTEVPQSAAVGAAATKPRSASSLQLVSLPVSVRPPGQSLTAR